MQGNQRYGRQNNSNRRGIGIGVGHMRDKKETEEMIEALVTVD